MPVAPAAWAATAAEGGVGGLGAGRAATAGIAVVMIVLGAAAALTTFRKAAAKASPAATAAESQAAAASPGVGGAADTTRTTPGRMATGVFESAFVANPVWLRCDFEEFGVEWSTDGVDAQEYSCILDELTVVLVRVVAATWGSKFASAVAIVDTEVQELSRTADRGEP